MTTITACPECKSRELKIFATQNVTAHVTFRGSDDHQVWDTEPGDTQWSGQSDAECGDCDYFGPLSTFEIPDPAIVRPVTVERIIEMGEEIWGIAYTPEAAQATLDTITTDLNDADLEAVMAEDGYVPAEEESA